MAGNEPITWDDIDEALGLVSPPDQRDEMVGYFRDAGFDEQQARRGAELMESGRYFGFVDVATSLAGGYRFDGGSRPISPIQQERIVAVGRRIEEAKASSQQQSGTGVTGA